ncbi:hypothetical protein B0J14DRAFT_578754 [Halenospora varia]|nr:hypothetical protein B0J14DRAFT_578754 [Halenospora varia]
MSSPSRARRLDQDDSSSPPFPGHNLSLNYRATSYQTHVDCAGATLNPEAAASNPFANLELQRASAAFTCFGDLPAELRLSIWRLAFPTPRRIHFSIFFRISFLFYKTDRDLLSKLPITLHVNQESRQETLQYYQISWFSLGDIPICFSPTRDHFWYPTGTGGTNRALWSAIKNHFPNFLPSIQIVEIQLSQWREEGETVKWFRDLAQFPALREVRICRGPSGGHLPLEVRNQELQDWVEAARLFLEGHKENFYEMALPAVRTGYCPSPPSLVASSYFHVWLQRTK